MLDLLFLHEPDSDLQDWDEFEKEIDAQVNAALNLANGLDDCTEANGITEKACSGLKFEDYATFSKAMDDLNDSIKQRRRQKNRLRFLMILVLLLVTWPIVGSYFTRIF